MPLLPEKVRWAVENIPFATQRLFAFCYNQDGTLLHAPKNNYPSSDSTDLMELCTDVREFILPSQDSQENALPLTAFLNEERTFLRVSLLTAEHISRRRAGKVTSNFIYGVPSVMLYCKAEGVYIGLVYPLLNSVEHMLGCVTRDMLVVLGFDDEIVMHTELFNRSLDKEAQRDGKLYMEDLADPAQWALLAGRDSRAFETMLAAEKAAAASPWSVVMEGAAFDPAGWVTGEPERWRFGPDTLEIPDDFNRNAFITCTEETEHLKRDIRIEFTADLSAFSGIGVCFFSNIGKIRSDIGFLDAEGYNFQIMCLSPGSWEMRLKKYSRVIESGMINLKPFLEAAGDLTAVRVSFEKSGAGLFHFYFNGAPAGTLRDKEPILRSGNFHFSLLGGKRTRYRDLRVSVRSCPLDPASFPPASVEMKLRHMPDHVFEARFGAITGHTGLDGLRYVFLKDVTFGKGLLDKVNRYVREIDEDLNTARRIQSQMTRFSLPESPLIRFSCLYRPSGKVGGDMLDIRDLGDNRYAALIYDVAGHGIAASLITSMAKMSFDAAFRRSSSPAEIMRYVNTDVCAVTDPSMFLTAFLFVLDLETYTLTYARAGHCIPALFSAKRPLPLLLEKGGAIIGNSPSFQFDEYRVQVRPGDRGLLYTDGIIEIRDKADNFFGRPRLFELMQAGLDLPLDEMRFRLYQAAEKYNNGDRFEDDMAAVLFDISPGNAS